MPTFVLQGPDNTANFKIDYSGELNQEQLDVVLHGDGPCLVLAGAGSGKTRTITYRVAYLLEHGVDPSSILLLTFTNKAAREMLERVSQLLVGGAQGLWGGTFHSVANRLLRMYVNEVGYAPGFSILDQEDARTLIKAILKELHIDPKVRRFPSPAVLQDLISYHRNVMVTMEEAISMKHPSFSELTDDIKEVTRRYEERKRASNSMDFDDLLFYWLLLAEHPGIGEMMSNRFRYILVDEYQDTNALQARIVRALARVHRNVLVVGDDAQSIYAFRGADVKNILSFPTQWEQSSVFKLLTNYRSVPEILDVANDSLSHNTDQFEKELIGIRPKGKRPLVVPALSARQEAQYIAEQVLALRSEGTALANMAVLFRSSAHSQALEFELVKRDIPYEYRGGMKFFGRAHIKDVLAYLRVIQNVHDEPAWLRVLGIQQGIGATTAANIAVQARAAQDIQAIVGADVSLSLPARARVGWESLMDTLRITIGSSTEPAIMIRTILNSPYQEYLEREYPDFRDRIEDLEQLETFAESYKDLTGLLADISLYDGVVTERDERQGKGDDERMVLTTIHQAKGLEWDTVFVMHLTDQAFPSQRSIATEGGLEEERRLFYVAVTRARQRLFLTYPQTMGYDTLVFNRPSVFLEEISPRLTERLELREAQQPSHASRLRPGMSDSWSFEEPFSDDEGVIEVDKSGDLFHASPSRSNTIWKSVTPKKSSPPKSYLR